MHALAFLELGGGNAARGEEAVDQLQRHAAWASVWLVSTEIRMPVHYRDDLIVHDRNAILAESARRPFAWTAGENCTHLIWGPGACAVAAEVFMGSPAWFMVWDGVALLDGGNADRQAEILADACDLALKDHQ